MKYNVRNTNIFDYRTGPDNQIESRGTDTVQVDITRKAQTEELNNFGSVPEVGEVRAELQPVERQQQDTTEAKVQEVGSSPSAKRSSDDESEAESDRETAGYDEIPELVAGSIHKQEKRAFWRDELKADNYILDMLEHGYKLPFREGQLPQRYQEKNNKSAMKHSGFAIKEAEKWASKKVVKEVKEKPWCISPLTVAERQIGEQEKLRLCLDLSRYINKLLKKEAVKLAGLEVCTQALLPGDFIATYDLSSAFHHIKIHESHQKYLGFALPEERDGDPERYFIFLVMPFGLASAVKCITRVTKPLCCYLASRGIRHSIYIDDGNALARTLALLLKHLAIILEALDLSLIHI